MAVICRNDRIQFPVTDTLTPICLYAAFFQQLDSGKVAVVPAPPSSLVAKRHGSGLLHEPQAQPSVYGSVTYSHLPVVWVVQPDTA